MRAATSGTIEHKLARYLMRERGQAGAMSYATAQFFEHEMDDSTLICEHWQRVILELCGLTNQPPQTIYLDSYQSARILLGQFGEAEALHVAAERAGRCDMLGQAVYARIITAIAGLAQMEPRKGEWVQ